MNALFPGHFLRESYWWGKSDRLRNRSVFRIGIGGRKIDRSRLEPWMGLLGTAKLAVLTPVGPVSMSARGSRGVL